ncbi:Rpn family recombination-promoting nuclease/putative transposase [Paenibacillus sp. CAU 1782]
MEERLDPRNDFVFKRIFGSEDNRDVLLAFLNAVLAEGDGPLLTEVEVQNPYTEKDSPSDKQSIFDIWAKASDGSLVDVEMQLFNKYDIEKRTLYYWSKRYSSQLHEGETYKGLKRCITINLLNFSIIPNDLYHNVFHLQERNSHIILCKDIEVHMMELSKLNHCDMPAGSGLLNWLLFLKNDDSYDWEALRLNEPKLDKAMDTLQFLSQDKEARRLYEQRQKYLHDQASMLDWATDNGMKKGIEQSIEQGRLEGQYKKAAEIAGNMLELGIDITMIVKASGLTHAEVEEIRTKRSL